MVGSRGSREGESVVEEGVAGNEVEVEQGGLVAVAVRRGRGWQDGRMAGRGGGHSEMAGFHQIWLIFIKKKKDHSLRCTQSLQVYI